MESADPSQLEEALTQAVNKRQLRSIDGGTLLLSTADARVGLELAMQTEVEDLFPALMDKKGKVCFVFVCLRRTHSHTCVHTDVLISPLLLLSFFLSFFF